MNKNKILSILMLAMLSVNFVSAEMIDLTNDDFNNSKEQATDQAKENIIKTMKDTISTVDTEPNDKIVSVEGDSGHTYAFAYLTPLRQFGYIYATIKIDEDNDKKIDKGNKVVYSDALAHPDGLKWGTTDSKDEKWVYGSLYTNANDYFTNVLKSTVAIKDSDIPKAFVQKKLDGTEFVATTLYVRWTYDVYWKNDCNRNGTKLAYAPILERDSGGKGPYFSIGEWSENNPGIMTELKLTKDPQYNANAANVKTAIQTIRSGKDETGEKRRLMPYKEIMGSNPPNVPYLTYDMEKNGTRGVDNRNGVFEKHAEVRRIITRKDGSTVNYEAVIPVKTVTTKSQVKTPDLAPKVNIDVNVDGEGTTSNKMTVDMSLLTRKPTYNYKTDETKYTFKRDRNGVLNNYKIDEPRYNQLDVWHDKVLPKLVIRDTNDLVLYETSDLKQLMDTGNQTLVFDNTDFNIAAANGGVANIEVDFRSNIRYQKEEVDYNTKYKGWNLGELNTIDQLEVKVNQHVNSSSKPGYETRESLVSTVKDAYVKSNPRIEKTFLTTRHSDIQISASASIWALYEDGDLSAPEVTVTTNPLNTLTKVEGGKFDVITEAKYITKDPNLVYEEDKNYIVSNEYDIPSGEVGEHLWVEDFKIDRVQVVALDDNNSVIYDETYGNDFIIDDSTIGRLEAIIKDLDAKPSQIGQAEVKVYYSYKQCHRQWKKTPSEEYDIVDGKAIPRQWYIDAKTTKTPQRGEAVGYFNVYSLTGTTD